jgi:biopolymer transport protein ExbD
MSLTPMIDVVFLLLVFFMLAARFDQTAVLFGLFRPSAAD